MTPRIQVQRFAEDMEKKLRANDHKGGWQNMSLDDLLLRLEEETQELRDAIEMKDSPSKIVGEAADVGNFAMMIADICRAWSAGSSGESGGTP